MARHIWQWMLAMGCGLFLCCTLLQAAPHRLTDTQLDEVYAAGFNIQVDLDMDLAASDPNAVFVTGNGADALQQFMHQGMTLARTSGGMRNETSFDPSGAYMPNLEEFTVNNINITDNALQNANTLMNIFALEGDVAVGLNLNVVVNPTDSIFNVTQTNINMSTFGLSDAFTTLIPTGY